LWEHLLILYSTGLYCLYYSQPLCCQQPPGFGILPWCICNYSSLEATTIVLYCTILYCTIQDCNWTLHSHQHQHRQSCIIEDRVVYNIQPYRLLLHNTIRRLGNQIYWYWAVLPSLHCFRLHPHAPSRPAPAPAKPSSTGTHSTVSTLTTATRARLLCSPYKINQNS
jgi:hypothetical protein